MIKENDGKKNSKNSNYGEDRGYYDRNVGRKKRIGDIEDR